jgi:hypothetical protein
LWADAPGHTRYVQAKSLDISQSGIRIEAPEPIAVSTSLWLRADSINLAGSAVVKHVSRHGSVYIVGLELSESVSKQALALTRKLWALGAPVSAA